MEWISVEDRLPETDKIVLVMTDNGYALARYHDDVNGMCEWQNFDFEASICAKRFTCSYVTHWMPLPLPPNDKSFDASTSTCEQVNNLKNDDSCSRHV